MFFDLYETLVTHFDPAWTPPLQTIAQRLGLDERTWTNDWKRFDTAWQVGEISSYAEALSALCVSAGQQADPNVMRQLAQEYRQQTQRVFVAIEDELVELVVRLKQRGLKLGVITNASDLDAAPWFECCLSPYFDDFVASCEVGLLKHDERIFHLACLRLDVEPADSVFVGDGGGNELVTTLSAGLTVYWCTWFLERWPDGIRPNGFPGDEWRQYADVQPPFERLQRPSELLGAAMNNSVNSQAALASRVELTFIEADLRVFYDLAHSRNLDQLRPVIILTLITFLSSFVLESATYSESRGWLSSATNWR